MGMDGPGSPSELLTMTLAWGLTRAEAEVALMMHSGATLAAIAETRNASIHTVRNQAKAAMMKSGCVRQIDLVLAIERLGR